jgi:NAD(P)-dependent dehydrogenase (short-subunit alcohol dehydrogenase family)
VPPSLHGDVAIVTGAGKGIGEAIAQALAAAGARVAVTSRVVSDAERVAATLGPGHVALGLDVRSSTAVDAAVAAARDALGVPTILVNNAGVNRLGPSESYSDDDWERVLDVNLTGTFRCCRAVGALMLAAGRGSIVNIASIIGASVGMPWRAPYASSKAGLVGLTRTLAVEWAGRGVRVNALLPGPVQTSMVAETIARGAIDEQLVEDGPRDIFIAQGHEGQVIIVVPSKDLIVVRLGLFDDYVGSPLTFGAAHPASRRLEEA